MAARRTSIFVTPAVPPSLELQKAGTGSDGPGKAAEVTPEESAVSVAAAGSESGSEPATQVTLSSLSSVQTSSTDADAGKPDKYDNVIQIGNEFYTDKGVPIGDLVQAMDMDHVSYYAGCLANPSDAITVPPFDALHKFYIHPQPSVRAAAQEEIERHRDSSLYGYDVRFAVDPARPMAGKYMINMEVAFIPNEMVVEAIVENGQSYRQHFYSDPKDSSFWPFCKYWNFAVQPHDTLWQTIMGSGTALGATVEAYNERAELRRGGGEKAKIVFGFTTQLTDKFIWSDIQVS
jgi:hypothetical protein